MVSSKSMLNKVRLLLCVVAMVQAATAQSCGGCDGVLWACEVDCDAQYDGCSWIRWFWGLCDSDRDTCRAACRSSNNCDVTCELACCASVERCFSMEAPFSDFDLPDCDNLLTFRLYRPGVSGWTEMTSTNIPTSYVATDPTVVVIHGYNGDADNPDYTTMREAVFTQGDCNFIMVDWQQGPGIGSYEVAASTTRVTGEALYQIVSQLPNTHLWCVGFSLGAHTCGFAGKYGVHWDRITGLDPAGPSFDGAQCTNQADICHLYPSDATHVDVIHTDGDDPFQPGFGTRVPMGHVDFYPNGASQQPGCALSFSISCSHDRAFYYFVESITTDCFTSTHVCTDQNDLPNSCTPCSSGQCPNMGFSAGTGSGLYYLETNDDEPYCQG